MKALTKEEFEKAPIEIQYIYIAGASKLLIGISIYEQAKKDYPEYFTDELELEHKYENIPQDVLDAYNAELKARCSEVKKPSRAGGCGFLYWINHADEYTEQKAQVEAWIREVHRIEYELHIKYLSQHGIPVPYYLRPLAPAIKKPTRTRKTTKAIKVHPFKYFMQ